MIDDAAFNLLVRSSTLVGDRGWRYWWRLWTGLAAMRAGTEVSTSIHGRRVRVPVGYPYQIWSRRYPGYNAPLLEAAFEAHDVLGHPIRTVDVGAAVGDTVLLLLANMPAGTVEDVLCIEPDDAFAAMARDNLAAERVARVSQVLLARGGGRVPDLVRTHPGTASAQGAGRRDAVAFDDLGAGRVDLFKVDVDGMDGAVLAGAAAHLRRDRPMVVFEWHPVLYEATGNDWFEPFRVLAGAGYGDAVWFDKFGRFCGTSALGDDEVVGRRSDECRVDRRAEDWHYDVVAIPAGAPYEASAARIAGLCRAGARVSRY